MRTSQEKTPYRVFYCCYSTDSRIESEVAVPADKRLFLVLASQVLLKATDFFGIIDAHGGVLQFYIEKDGRIWMEVPAPEKKGSYGCHITKNEMESVLRDPPVYFTPGKFPKLEFTAW
jgi:hypothetical protein